MESLDINELKDLIQKYPWFALARREYFIRMSQMGTEHTEEGISQAAIYLSSRLPLYRMLDKQRKQSATSEAAYPPIPLNTDFSLPDPQDKQDVPKIIVVGGDYFSPADFEELAKTKSETPVTVAPKVTRQPVQKESSPISSEDSGFFDEDFYTETLGKIYAEQGFSQRALEVYEKLILLYPEKNAYFAALIEEIKKHL